MPNEKIKHAVDELLDFFDLERGDFWRALFVLFLLVSYFTSFVIQHPHYYLVCPKL